MWYIWDEKNDRNYKSIVGEYDKLFKKYLQMFSETMKIQRVEASLRIFSISVSSVSASAYKSANPG